MPEIDELQNLIDNPRESLNVEIKSWLNLTNPKDKAKIAKATMALRNYNGGKIILGFDDTTLQPDLDNPPGDVRTIYSQDTVQSIVSQYSSDAFQVTIEFRTRDGVEFPIIIVPSGVSTIVANQRDLLDGNTSLLKQGDVYFRTLNSNNTPSSAKANWKDWPQICQIIFDNREADIGRFFRRHLTGLSGNTIQELVDSVTTTLNPEPDDNEQLQTFMNESENKFFLKVQERNANLPDFGYWEAAFLIKGNTIQEERRPTRPFLRRLDANNPRHTGWPIWRNSEGSSDESNRPYVEDGMWEALSYDMSNRSFNHIDFMRIDPNGKFYYLRAFEDDTTISDRAPDTMTGLDFSLVIWRVAEAISVGLSYARAMEYDAQNSSLLFSFRWNELSGRQNISWTSRDYFLPSSEVAQQNKVCSEIIVPLDTPQSALGTFVKNATSPLFEVFGGYELGQEAVNNIVAQALRGRY